MKAKEAKIVWNPAWVQHRKPGVDVIPLADPDHTFLFTGGASYRVWQEAEPMKLRAMMFTDFNTLVVRDGVDPLEAHRAFLKIDEYRLWIAPDQEGADAEAGELGGFG